MISLTHNLTCLHGHLYTLSRRSTVVLWGYRSRTQIFLCREVILTWMNRTLIWITSSWLVYQQIQIPNKTQTAHHKCLICLTNAKNWWLTKAQSAVFHWSCYRMHPTTLTGTRKSQLNSKTLNPSSKIKIKQTKSTMKAINSNYLPVPLFHCMWLTISK